MRISNAWLAAISLFVLGAFVPPPLSADVMYQTAATCGANETIATTTDGSILLSTAPANAGSGGCGITAATPSGATGLIARYQGSATVNVSFAAASVSGSMATTQGSVNFTAGSFTGTAGTSIYTNAAPGTVMKITMTGTASGSTGGSNGFPGAVANFSTGSGHGGSSNATQTYTVPVQNSGIVVGGVPFYFVDSITAHGQAGGSLRDGGGGSALFSASISLSLQVVGNILNYVSGTGQTGLVGTPLPRSLSVRVVDGQTGAPVGNVPVVFSIKSTPSGGQDASVSGGGNSDGSTGIVSATLTLGSASGSYTVAAVCRSCAVQEVDFTANAKTLQQATVLKLINCDKTDVPGSAISNPVEVEAYNTVTGDGEPLLEVDFSNPSVSATQFKTLTDGNGTADFPTLFPSAATSVTINAFCPQCQANPAVSCTITAAPPPKTNNNGQSSPTGQGPPVGPGPSPNPGSGQGTFNVAIAFQALQPTISPNAKKIVRPRIDHIGVLQGDTIRLTVQLDPPSAVADSDFQWSGAQSFTGCNQSNTAFGRCSIDVTLNSTGFTTESVSVQGNSASVSIEVGANPPGPGVYQYCLTHPSALLACKANRFGERTLRSIAESWAYSVAPTLTDGTQGCHNGRCDALRHALWNALMSNQYGSTVALGISFGHEYDELGGPHNDTLMDLDNNLAGAQIGEGFGSGSASTSNLELAVQGAMLSGHLTILDEFDWNGQTLTGLMRASNQAP